MPQDTAKNITARCTEVLRAIIFLPSNHAGKNSDIIITAVRPRIRFPLKIIDSMTLATTMVEECNKEDTGVGPSIAIGNQYLKTQMADFLRIAIKHRDQLSIE